MLDFIGNQHRQFRFDLRYSALTGAARGDLVHQAEQGFPFLPSGCHLELDRVASQIVLDNIRRQIQRPARELVRDLQRLAAEGDVTLAAFLGRADVPLEALYGYSGFTGWMGLRRVAGLPAPAPGPDEDQLATAIGDCCTSPTPNASKAGSTC